MNRLSYLEFGCDMWCCDLNVSSIARMHNVYFVYPLNSALWDLIIAFWESWFLFLPLMHFPQDWQFKNLYLCIRDVGCIIWRTSCHHQIQDQICSITNKLEYILFPYLEEKLLSFLTFFWSQLMSCLQTLEFSSQLDREFCFSAH